MMDERFNPATLLEIFPPSRTDDFFEALFGGAEEGAYDIRLTFLGGEGGKLEFGFELHQRPGMCLACNLTTGLPQVFSRHPIIDAKGLSAQLAQLAGWKEYSWEIGATRQLSNALHIVPLTLSQA